MDTKKEQAYAEMKEITNTSMPDSKNHGSEWWRGQVKNKSFADACNFIRTQLILNKYTSKGMRHKANEVNTSIHPNHQVKNLRRVPLESWKILPDKVRELWLNMRLQEKETINGMPRMLWKN